MIADGDRGRGHGRDRESAGARSDPGPDGHATAPYADDAHDPNYQRGKTQNVIPSPYTHDQQS